MKRISNAAERVLSAVHEKNKQGELPGKIAVCAAGTGWMDSPYLMPARSRANRYRLIDELIDDGYLVNEGRPNGAYRLRCTDLGRTASAASRHHF